MEPPTADLPVAASPAQLLLYIQVDEVRGLPSDRGAKLFVEVRVDGGEHKEAATSVCTRVVRAAKGDTCARWPHALRVELPPALGDPPAPRAARVLLWRYSRMLRNTLLGEATLALPPVSADAALALSCGATIAVSGLRVAPAPAARASAPAAQFTREQFCLFLSFAAYSAFGCSGSSAGIARRVRADVAELLERARPRVAEDDGWEVVWGPCVHQARGSSVADASLWAVRSARSAEVVVVVAGTNPLSLFDWFLLDASVFSTEAWLAGPPGALVAQGSARGLQLVSSLRDEAGEDLFSFLAREAGAGRVSSLCTTGHSLGGALSQLLALAAVERRANWDPQGTASVCCVSIAAPTVGNAVFAAYYDERLGANTSRIANELDVVPNGWDAERVRWLPMLYAPVINYELKIGAVAKPISSLLRRKKIGYTHAMADVKPFRVGEPSHRRSFAEEAVYQHMVPYFEFLECADVLPLLASKNALFGDILLGKDMGVLDNAKKALEVLQNKVK